MRDLPFVKEADGTEATSTGTAGEAQQLDPTELEGVIAELTQEELDAREAAIRRERKPMGPPLELALEGAPDEEDAPIDPKGPPDDERE